MKQFDPTPQRVARARRDGDHPISRDAVAVASFAATISALAASWPLLLPALRDALRRALDGDSRVPLLTLLVLLVTSICVLDAIAAGAATIVQTRGIVPRFPSWRLAFTRIMSAESLGATARATFALIVGGFAIAMLTAPNPHGIERVAVAAVLTGGAAAAVDIFAVHSAWRRRLRMTHDELRRDVREEEGDAHVRGRRKRQHRALLRGALREVRRASFVVVNPTHVAVALRYAPPATPVPEMLVRAADQKARRVRRIAAETSIPIVEQPELAHQLYALDTLGPIPPEAYIAVAQIVAQLQRA